MANTARKARKREGIPFERKPKVGTPIIERMVPSVTDRGGSILGAVHTHLSKRVMRKRARDMETLGIEIPKPA